MKTLNKLFENSEFEKYTIYLSPNPVKESFEIEGLNNTALKDLVICDSQGRIVKQIPHYIANDKISTNCFTKGIYFLFCKDELNKCYTFKIVKC